MVIALISAGILFNHDLGPAACHGNDTHGPSSRLCNFAQSSPARCWLPTVWGQASSCRRRHAAKSDQHPRQVGQALEMALLALPWTVGQRGRMYFAPGGLRSGCWAPQVRAWWRDSYSSKLCSWCFAASLSRGIVLMSKVTTKQFETRTKNN